MSSIVVAVIFVLGTAISPLLLAAFINKQSRRDKAVESAERAKVAKQVADAAELLKTAQSEAARLAAEAAADLIATTADLTARTDEVARLAAQKGSTAAPSVMGPTRCVMLEYPNGNRQEITLSGVPRIGESIRRRPTRLGRRPCPTPTPSSPS